MPAKRLLPIFTVCLLTLTMTTLMTFTLSALAQSPSLPKPPDTPQHAVTDEYQGVKVTDDYRWLENWDDPAVKQWSAAENARTREYLDQVPARPAIKNRLRQLVTSRSVTYSALQFRAGMLFAEKHQPPLQQPMLVVMRSPDDPASARVIFDPNAANAKGSLAVDFYVPSFGGKYVAAALSQNGSEDAEAHVFEVATGKQLRDVVPRVNFATAGGSIAWKPDSSGFYYTRYPQGNERPHEDANFYQQVYFHKLGTDPAQDIYVLGKDLPRIAEIQLHASDDGRWLLASVGNGDGGQFAHYLMDADGHWTQLTRFEDGIVRVKFGADPALYLLSRKDAPRGQILRLPLSHLDLAQAKVLVPQSSGTGSDESDRASIEDFVPAWNHLYVIDIMGGPSRVRVFEAAVYERGSTPGFSPKGEIPLPPISAVGQVVSIGGGDVLFYVSSFLEPPVLYRFDAATRSTTRIVTAAQLSAIKFNDAEVVREFAPSKDGTRVPLNIIRLKGTKLDGTHPTLLTGYGGYGISRKPFFQGRFARLWLDQGGIFVEANLRGGAEYGEEWHAAGNLTHKQNVFDDFLACAQYLIDQNYTSPAHLAIMGGSNGGLLMGAAFTQRPDLFRAVVSYVGIYDMLRVELDPNGAFNVTEFGTVKDPDQFKALYAYSPYHHVKAGTAYPAILMPTGENDHRVNPMQSRKMIALLQADDGSGHPILLRTSSSAGHGLIGASLDEQIEQDTDVFSFLFDQLGIQYK
jgi:prolyl oligopeptidase